MNEKTQTQTQPGISGLQRGESEGRELERIKEDIRKTIRSIREGHTTGGYCETEKLKAEEKKLHHILTVQLEELQAKPGAQSEKVKRDIERELAGISYRPRLVVAADN